MRKDLPSWSTIGLIFCIIVSLMLPTGIKAAIESKKTPIYISQKICINRKSDYYEICGTLANKTNQDVCIDFIQISARGKSNNTNYFARPIVIQNINIEANATYEIYRTDLRYIGENGELDLGYLTEAYISKCEINGKSVNLRESNEYSELILFSMVGGIAYIGAIAIIVYKVKDKNKSKSIESVEW